VKERGMSVEADDFLEVLSTPGPQEVMASGHLLRPGNRVRLKPHQGGDVIDMALAGRLAVIEGIEQDDTGTTHVAVILEDDPAADLAAARHPAHRFFFAPDEIAPAGAGFKPVPTMRILVAGIGNVFLGDDGFGPAVAQYLTKRELPREINVVDFGIRGMDLAYALSQPCDVAILVDTVARGGPVGSLYVIEPDMDGCEETSFDSHRMEPTAVLRLARRLGRLPPRVLLVGCEPTEAMASESMSMKLSDPVAAAVEEAARIVLKLASQLLTGDRLDMKQESSNENDTVHSSGNLDRPAGQQVPPQPR
jgi:hydrogenase maturation protease